MKEILIEKILNTTTQDNENINELRLRLYEMTYILTYCIKLLYKHNFMVSDQIITTLKNHINDVCEITLTDEEYVSIVSFIIQNKKDVYKILLTNNEYKNVVSTDNVLKVIDLNSQEGGSISWLTEDTNEYTKVLDIIGLVIDILGFIPGLGILIDASGFILSVLRFQWFDAICSLINMIPIIGSFIGTPLKYLRKYDRIKKIRELRGMVNKEKILNVNN